MDLGFEKFIISQKAVIFRDGKCLILELSDKPGFWDMPGGRIDSGENADFAFEREIKEEIGFDDLQDSKIYLRKSFSYFSKTEGKMVPVCALFFIVNDESQRGIVLSEEHSQYKWIEKDEVKNYKFFWEFMPEVIKKGFEN